MEHNSLERCIKLLLMGGLIVGTLPAAAKAVQQDSKNNTTQSITGTRIAQQDVTSALPVTIYTREDILRSGESNAADFIRSLPINTSGSFRPQSGSSAQGDATVALRGFGANRSLVLIDGRRMPKSPSIPAWQNLSLIPMGAIERIEVLAEGASAIYGADAVGGVVNIITRTDFQGAEIMLGAAEVSIPNNGGEREEGSVVFGAKSARSSLIAGVSWNDREIIYTRDVPWRSPGESVYGNSFTTLSGGFDEFNLSSFIGGCEFPDSGFFTTTNTSSLNGTRCAYDFTSVAAEEASSENKAFYLKAKHELNDRWFLQANTRFSQAESFGRYAPVPDSSYFSTPLSSNSPNNPTNPNSPLYDPSLGLNPQQVNWWHRFAALGNRDTTVTNQMLDMTLALSGQIGQTELEFGVRHTDNRMQDVGRNFLLRSAAQALIEDGSYSLLNPYTAPENVLNSMRVTIFREGKYDQDEVFGGVTFDAFKLYERPVVVHLGAEYRKVKYADLYDPQSEAGQVGGSVGNSAAGDRKVSSAFFEASFPVMEGLQVNLAGRYDDHSDFGSETSSKINVNWQPFEVLSFQAQYSEDFVAPDLAKLNRKPLITLVSIPGFNIYANEERANPFLKAEKVDQFSFSTTYHPLGWLKIGVEYWQLELTDRITLFSGQSLINLINNGEQVPLGLGCFYNEIGRIERCITGYGNAGTIEHSGYNLNISSEFKMLGGSVSSQLQMTELLNSQVNNGTDFTSRPGIPPIRVLLTNTYQKDSWSLTYQLNYISAHRTDQFSAIIPAPTWVTHDFQFKYNTPWQSTITAGVKNAGEKSPPIGAGFTNNRDYDLNLYDGYGRIVYARYTQIF